MYKLWGRRILGTKASRKGSLKIWIPEEYFVYSPK